MLTGAPRLRVPPGGWASSQVPPAACPVTPSCSEPRPHLACRFSTSMLFSLSILHSSSRCLRASSRTVSQARSSCSFSCSSRALALRRDRPERSHGARENQEPPLLPWAEAGVIHSWAQAETQVGTTFGVDRLHPKGALHGKTSPTQVIPQQR